MFKTLPMTEHSVMPKARNLAITFRDNILNLVVVLVDGPELVAKDLSQTVRTDGKIYQDKAMVESQRVLLYLFHKALIRV